MHKFAIPLFLILSGPGWADSVSGTLEVAGKPLKAVDIVMSYDRSGHKLYVKLAGRPMTVDEKKFTAAGVNTSWTFAELTIPVTESGGQLTVRGDGKLMLYHSTNMQTNWADFPMARSLLTVSGAPREGVQVQTSGQASGASWNLILDGQLYDRDERKIKQFPPVEVGQQVVTIDASWTPKGLPDVSFGAGPKGSSSGQGITEPGAVQELITALERNNDFRYRSIRVANESGVCTIYTGNGPVVLDAEARAKVVATLKAAAKHLHIPGF